MNYKKKALKNLRYTLIPGLILAVVGFIKVRYIIIICGSEINGLYLYMLQLAHYFQLIDIGVGQVYKTMLYNPLFDGDLQTVSNLIYSAKRYFRRASNISIIFFFIFLPLLVVGNSTHEIPITDLVIIFVLYSLPIILTYRISYLRYFVNSIQKDYINWGIYYVAEIIKCLLILVLINVYRSIYCVFFIEISISFLTTFLYYIVEKKYIIKYEKIIPNEIIKFQNAKYVVVERVANQINAQLDVQLLGISGSLASISVYKAYQYIIDSLDLILINALTTMESVIGNLLCNSKKNAVRFFYLCQALIFFLSLLVSSCFYFCADKFVFYFMSGGNSSYVLSKYCIFMFSLIVFYKILSVNENNYLNSAGRFKEKSYGIIISVITNFLISILLVRNLGITGLLLGTIISYYIPKLINEVYIVSKKILNDSFIKSILKKIFSILIYLCFLYFCKFLFDLLKVKNLNIIIQFIVIILVICGLIAVLSLIILYVIMKINLNNSINKEEFTEDK